MKMIQERNQNKFNDKFFFRRGGFTSVHLSTEVNKLCPQSVSNKTFIIMIFW